VVLKLGRYLEEQQGQGRFRFQATGGAAEVLVGLVVSDQQVRRLLGTLSEPESAQVEDGRSERGKHFSRCLRPVDSKSVRRMGCHRSGHSGAARAAPLNWAS